MGRSVRNVEAWVREKNLSVAESSKQLLKVSEEISEVVAALAGDNKDDLRDGIGDIMVTLIVLAMQSDMDLYECLNQAYNEIEDRKGKNVSGVSVKESDLSSQCQIVLF